MACRSHVVAMHMQHFRMPMMHLAHTKLSSVRECVELAGTCACPKELMQLLKKCDQYRHDIMVAMLPFARLSCTNKELNALATFVSPIGKKLLQCHSKLYCLRCVARGEDYTDGDTTDSDDEAYYVIGVIT